MKKYEFSKLNAENFPEEQRDSVEDINKELEELGKEINSFIDEVSKRLENPEVKEPKNYKIPKPTKRTKYSMLTKKQVISNYPEYRALINAVVSGIGGMQYIDDVNRYGINGGFGSFIYYSDTCAFAHRYQKKIIALLEQDADDFGQEVVEMVSWFGIFKGDMPADDKRELYRFLSGSKCKDTTIPNLMAWYAAETVCRWFED